MRTKWKKPRSGKSQELENGEESENGLNGVQNGSKALQQEGSITDQESSNAIQPNSDFADLGTAQKCLNVEQRNLDTNPDNSNGMNSGV